ncbi:hypothetical protein HAX54_028448 [Datura stramonium]|uniref:Uncharacterized protein n=1 Tax=Datura stramonium TaxID=4076 RepID=A0ABS8RKR4_DATST|nr:hypothetical protein [Datura stramonium]
MKGKLLCQLERYSSWDSLTLHQMMENLGIMLAYGTGCIPKLLCGLPIRTNQLIPISDERLVIAIDEDGKRLWQSFDNPTDTSLPGMRMDDGLKLTGWGVTQKDPSSGSYMFRLNKQTTLRSPHSKARSSTGKALLLLIPLVSGNCPLLWCQC